MKHSKAGTVAFVGILSALALTLSALEGLLPPLPFLPPGAKAGFSNVIVMFAVQWLGGPYGLVIALCKALFALLTRGGLAALMSFCGGVGAATITIFCVRMRASLILTGIIGALTHNLLQLLVVMAVTATPYWLGYLPLLLLFALVSGTVTGLLLKLTFSPLRRLAKQFRLRG
jgi:heptaprenyl diphosphate synthase